MATIWERLVHKMLAAPYPRFLRNATGETYLQRSPKQQIRIPDPKEHPASFGQFLGDAKDLTLKRDALTAFLRERKDAHRIQWDLEELLEQISTSHN